MRFLLGRTDVMGDLIISLPLMERVLSRQPDATFHWLVRPYTAPLLEGHPAVQGVHLRSEDQDLGALMAAVRPDAVLNLSHRDRAVTVAAARAGVPVRVARCRGLDQTWHATHRLWKGRFGSGRHESQNVLDFLQPWGWSGGVPPLPRLHLTEAERAEGRSALAGEGPTLGLILRGSGAGAFPGPAWWASARALLHQAGWRTVVLGPPEDSDLPATSLRGLLGRLAACDAVLGPSTGPLHAAAALGVPTLCLMGLRPNHTPDRWAPLGPAVQVLQYPGPEGDLSGGMDRLDPADLLPHLARFR